MTTSPKRASDNDRDQSPPMDPAKFEKLGDLLGRFGLNKISRATFWSLMAKHGFGQDDIDAWLAEDCRRDAQKRQVSGDA